MTSQAVKSLGRDVTDEHIARFCRKWRVRELALFGSVARGEAGSDSDVDLLVTFEDDAPWDLFDLTELRDELEVIFGRTVDLVERKALINPYRRKSILNDLEVLYAA